MERFTRKTLAAMAKLGMAKNITVSEYNTLPHMECVGTSVGQYGMNGALFRDDAGKFYVILARNSLLFQLV